MKYSYAFLPGECWWGGTVIHGDQMPFTEETEFSWDMNSMEPVGIVNQTMPLLLSSCGRYIWSDLPFAYAFEKGTITIEGEDVQLVKSGDTLKEAYLAAMRAHFPFDGKRLPDVFFETAQYNGWMQFMYDPTQEGVLEYARGIISHGFAPGILMIDEGWQAEYGTWIFDPLKFPDPRAMVDELHAMGFKVMLWVVPYVNASGYRYQYYTRFHPEHEQLFMRNTDGKRSLVNWWNGTSLSLDFTKECDRRFLDEQLQTLMNDFGIDGFKFDGGSVARYKDVVNGTPSLEHTAEERNNAWNDFGRRYTFHEYKDSYKQGGKNMIQRLADKASTWDGNGINKIVPSSLVQGLLGTPFICPDMIGGGEWSMFKFRLHSQMDQELFVRMAQCSVFLPMMQFSLAPWESLDEENLALCVRMATLHAQLAPEIIRLVHASETSGEPIVRHLEYNYPGSGFAHCNDCFMLGEKWLVAPVVHKGAVTRTLTLPEGTWKYVDGTVYGPGKVTVDAPLEYLPYFEKI